jgi:uncharacterized protein YbaR (Trm112 family)
VHGAGGGAPLCDLSVRVRERSGPPEQHARDGVAARLTHVVKRADQASRRRADGGGGEVVIVREVGVNEVELFPPHGLGETAKVREEPDGPVGVGEQGPGGPLRQKAPGQRTVPHARELRLDAGGRKRLHPVPDHSGRAGPLLGRDDVENPHRGAGYSRYTHAMALDPELLAILVCPKTRGPLELVELNEATRKGLVEKYREKFRDEEPVVTQGLYSREADLVYPIVSDIPVMLIDEALPGSEAR